MIYQNWTVKSHKNLDKIDKVMEIIISQKKNMITQRLESGIYIINQELYSIVTTQILASTLTNLEINNPNKKNTLNHNWDTIILINYQKKVWRLWITK